MIRRDERGVTAPLEYVYTFALATILITGLVIAATNTAGDQRQRTVEAQMEVVAEQVAGSLENADRIVRSTEGGVSTLRVEHELPDELLGSGYTVRIRDTPATPPVTTTTVIVSSSLTDDSVTAQADLEATTITNVQLVDGGTITIEYVSGALEVTDD